MLFRSIKYQQLVAYKHKHNGSTNVPSRYKQLGNWVRQQRKLYKANTMTGLRKRMLEGIGFEWFAPRSDWEGMYQLLCEYDQKHGHTNVPKRYSTHPKLGIWVQNQRAKRKANRLSEHQLMKLNALFFNWDCKQQYQYCYPSTMENH